MGLVTLAFACVSETKVGTRRGGAQLHTQSDIKRVVCSATARQQVRINTPLAFIEQHDFLQVGASPKGLSSVLSSQTCCVSQYVGDPLQLANQVSYTGVAPRVVYCTRFRATTMLCAKFVCQHSPMNRDACSTNKQATRMSRGRTVQ